MTTDARSNVNHPGMHFFCVDVETSALRVWEGELLSIGCVVVDADGNVVDDFYRRIDARGLHESWFNPDLPAISETQAWWREQGEFARMEAYQDRTLKRWAPQVAANHFRNFALTYGAEWTERIFVASPDKFDWVWTDYLFSKAKLSDPFWYHAIDMWSINHGAYTERRRGDNKGKLDLSQRFSSHDPIVEHHALSDAFALAQDLCEYLKNQPVELDAPHLDGYDSYLASTSEDDVEESVEPVE